MGSSSEEDGGRIAIGRDQSPRLMCQVLSLMEVSKATKQRKGRVRP